MLPLTGGHYGETWAPFSPWGGSRSVRVMMSSDCVVVDVATTGCTLDACALALQRAGATSVYALVVARRALGDDGHV